MIKHLICALTLCAFCACKETPAVPGTIDNPPTYKKSDLQKLRWIEGNWKSMVDGPGFYQAYSFPTDTTLEIVSYQFDGKDTSATNLSTVYWRNNHLYMGPNGEWVAVLLDKTKFQLNPVRDGWNNIQWTKNSKDEWTAVQQKPTFTRTIKMKRQPSLEELLKK